MTLEEEEHRRSLSSTASTNTTTNSIVDITNQNHSLDESSSDDSLETANQEVNAVEASEESSRRQATFSADQTDDERHVNQLRHYISQIHFDSETGQTSIPPELLAEDQDLLETEFENLGNDIDVIEMYMNRLDEHANHLQEKLRNLLDMIKNNNLPTN